MTNLECIDFYKKIEKLHWSEKTEYFNSLDVTQRKQYLDFLYSLLDGDDKVESLTDILRKQALSDG